MMKMEGKTAIAPKLPFSVGRAIGNSWKYGHPLSVEGCLIMLCERGVADFSVNSHRFSMTCGCMAFVVFDMVIVPVNVSDDFEAKFVALDFATAQDIFFLITSNRFWKFIYEAPVLRLPNDIRKVAYRWFEVIDWIVAHCSEITAEKALRNETENFMLIMSEQVESRQGLLGVDPAKNRAWVITNDFLGLLNRYYAHQHEVAFYADRLNITPNYLNIIIKKNIGTTAKEQINIQLCLVAKMLLDTTDLTVKEIAERLHYDDSSYLCRIFRKQTGMSPLQYRNKLRDNKKYVAHV